MDNFKTTGNKMIEGFKSLGTEGGPTKFYENLGNVPGTYGAKTTLAAAAAPLVDEALKPEEPPPETPVDSDPGQQFDYMANPVNSTQPVNPYGSEARYFNPQYVKRKTTRFADGGITGQGGLQLNIPLDIGGGSGGGSYGGGGNGGGTYPFQSSGGFTGNNNAPQVAQQAQDQAQRLAQQASATQGLGASQGPLLDAPQGPLLAGGSMGQFSYVEGGARPEGLGSLFNAQKMADGGVATDPDINQLRFATGGGISHLGDYSDGGRLLRGPGDGVSDSIPAVIGRKQPARLADGEFVVPARIVSELGNGSTEAGARKLYAMMDRIQKARGKTVGKGKVAKNSRSEKHLPA
jgi:hypothetical protein